MMAFHASPTPHLRAPLRRKPFTSPAPATSLPVAPCPAIQAHASSPQRSLSPQHAPFCTPRFSFFLREFPAAACVNNKSMLCVCVDGDECCP
jgi:hypothetical protein